MSVKEKIKSVVEKHNLMHIATVDAAGMPFVRGVDFVVGDIENVLYFATRQDSRKVQHLKGNDNVAVAIDHDCPQWEDLQSIVYLKGSGKGEIVAALDENQKAMGLLMQKFPFLKDLPGDPSDFVVIKVILAEVLLSDNTVSFGHTETVTY
jgi:nitroimidazol reductase NimA-like FMN-containing flavoprotein (pyridoxamine 5'-phosphate oxidase superfamily)